MDLRLTFNTDPKNYDDLRPTYVSQMFNDIIEYSHLNEKMSALEISIGTGQASLPFLKKGCHLTAVELGQDLAEFSRQKFKTYKNFNIINGDFEHTDLYEKSYDLIYSATAFHWIPIDLGVPKVKTLLKSGGVFAWFSNHPCPSKELLEIHNALQEVYHKYGEYFGNNSLHDIKAIDDINKMKLMDRKNIFDAYDFEDIVYQSYQSTRTLNADEYCNLLCTYSGHINLPDEIKSRFLKEVRNAIFSLGNELTINDTILLVMGRIR